MFVLVVVYYLPFKEINMAWLLTMSLEGLALQLGTGWDALARHLESSQAEIQEIYF